MGKWQKIYRIGEDWMGIEMKAPWAYCDKTSICFPKNVSLNLSDHKCLFKNYTEWSIILYS